MRFGLITLVIFLLPAIVFADEGMEQLPPELEADLVDPLTIEKNIPFADGESLKFKLGWGIFTVARTYLQTERDSYLERPALKLTLRTRTNGFADAIYKVRNTSTSWVAEDVSMSYEYSALQNEGGRERDTLAIFDPESLTARYINNRNGENREPVNVQPGTFDPLGIVFFLRCIDFEVGDKIVVPTSNGKEFFYTIVHVKEIVKRHFRYGEQEAYVLEPDIKDIGGVFKRSENGAIRFFISTDDKKLPLRMESEVAVGKFWAELVEVSVPDPESSVAVTEIE